MVVKTFLCESLQFYSKVVGIDGKFITAFAISGACESLLVTATEKFYFFFTHWPNLITSGIPWFIYREAIFRQIFTIPSLLSFFRSNCICANKKRTAKEKKLRQIKRRQVVELGWGWVKFYYNISIDWGLRANLLAKFYLE